MRLVWWVLGIKTSNPCLVAEVFPKHEDDDNYFTASVRDLGEAALVVAGIGKSIGVSEFRFDPDSTRDLELE